MVLIWLHHNAVFATFAPVFATMTDIKKVRYLKIDRGRYFYQRRIPLVVQDCFPDQNVWRRPCGDVPYAKAVQLVVTWAEEHDKLIARLKDPDQRAAHMVKMRKEQKAAEAIINERMGFEPIYAFPPEVVGTDIKAGPETSPNWLWANAELKELEKQRHGDAPSAQDEAQFLAILSRWKLGETVPDKKTIPPYQKFKEILNLQEYQRYREFIEFDPIPVKKMDNTRYAEGLRYILETAFGETAPNPPNNADDREEHFFVKNKIERKLSEVSPNPNTISALLEKYIIFNQIRPLTARKYRRDVTRLINVFGDLPINQITAIHLKELRQSLSSEIKPASVHAIFTPIKGLLRYAFNEGIIDFNPMSAVSLPQDKRPIEERKWKKFEPNEIQRIEDALKVMWGTDVQGMTEERRKAFVMVIRALIFTGMRPIEVLRLDPDDVSEKFLRIHGSKTESSTRVIPVHPEISDFPDWVRSGGLKTYQHIKTDAVGAVRHNFSRLIRKTLQPSILDEKKTLYSLRTTFVNAMRRAGADIQMQRAILGHKESGAIRHYDDGPEFDLKFESVSRTDPRVEKI